MNESHNDIEALRSYVEELKADRAAQKDKERREAWTKYVSLTVVIVAVFAAIATQWSGKYSSRTLVRLNDATFNQTQAANQWAYYQAKSVKQNLYEVSRSQIQDTADPNAAAKQRAVTDERIARYEKEKTEIKGKAEEFEQRRDQAREAATVASEKGSAMSLSVAVLTIAIAVASICLVTKKKPLWIISMLLAGAALTLMIRAWTR